MEAIKRLEELEREVKNLRGLVLFERDAVLEKKIVSLRGMGKLKVSEEGLEEAKRITSEEGETDIKQGFRSVSGNFRQQ